MLKLRIETDVETEKVKERSQRSHLISGIFQTLSLSLERNVYRNVITLQKSYELGPSIFLTLSTPLFKM